VIVETSPVEQAQTSPQRYRVRIFIDFWNFQLNWNDRAGATQNSCDWPKLPGVLMKQSTDLLAKIGTASLDLEETLVYASYRRGADGKLKNWLESFLNRQTSFRVHTVERRLKAARIRCLSCGLEMTVCPDCGKDYQRAPEKGVDTAIVTDLLSLAWEDAFDIAILVSSDADHVPAVTRLQEKGFKVINAAWRNHGFDLAKTAWGSFYLDDVIDTLRRPAPVTSTTVVVVNPPSAPEPLGPSTST
jgi:uncharacterized LabA/DUF88 family protein